MAHYQIHDCKVQKQSWTTDDLIGAGYFEHDFLCTQNRMTVAVSARNISQLPECVLSFSQMVSQWNNETVLPQIREYCINEVADKLGRLRLDERA